MGLFSTTILRQYILVTVLLVCSIFTVSLLHPLYPHHHPSEVAHDESLPHEHGDSSESYTPFATHGHEEESFLGLAVVFFVVAFFHIDQLFTTKTQIILVSERRNRPRRKPLILNLLFAQGILNPRLS